MAMRMTQCVTLLLLLLPLLTVLRVSEGRPSGDADYLYKYEDLNPMRQRPVSNDEKDVMTLLSLLLSMRRQRKHSPDVIPETDDVMGRDVRLRKRQRQCYWSVVTCY